MYGCSLKKYDGAVFCISFIDRQQESGLTLLLPFLWLKKYCERKKIVIHQYKNNGLNIVMDVNSGSVHVVDDIVYDMIPLIEPLVNEGIKDPDTIKAAVLNIANIPYPEENIREAVDEVLELQKAGQLFAPDIYENYIFDFKKRKTVVKALCLHIAHDCNLACKYCFAKKGNIMADVP